MCHVKLIHHCSQELRCPANYTSLVTIQFKSLSLSLDRITAWAKSFQNCTWGNQLFGGIVSKRQISWKHTRSKLNRGTNKVQTPDQASLGTELFYQSPSIPKVSRNLALFENLKEESWFSVSIEILNRYHFFVCNGTFPKAKLRQFRGDILRPRLVDLFKSRKKYSSW